MAVTGHFIGGEEVENHAKKTFPVVNPANGEIAGYAARGDAQDVAKAVAKARSAYRESWSKVAPSDRGKLLWKLADAVEKEGPKLAELDSIEVGRPIADAELDITAVANLLRFFGGIADKIRGTTLPVGPTFHTFTRREPYGVIGGIVPWNYPLYNAVVKLAPMLACGNTVVIKPAEESPSSAVALAKLAQSVGFPDGVFNVVNGVGDEAGAALASHPDVDKISFTGSTEVGRLILEMAAKSNLKGVTLELGGKSPNVIFEDADVETAVDAAAFSGFFNQGQTCTAGTRLLVHQSIYEAVLQRLKEKAASVKVGDPFDRSTNVGPLVSTKQLERVTNYVRLGRTQGARLVVGGSRPEIGSLAKGFYFCPTVFADVKPEMTIAKEEIFGPVLSVIPFKDEDDALAKANSISYGLAASVWTKNIARAHRFAAGVEAGLVWVNTIFSEHPSAPVGGYKQSGFGKEYGFEATEEYTRLKTVWVDTSGTFLKWP